VKVKKKKPNKAKKTKILFKKKTVMVSDTSSYKSKFNGIQSERGEMSRKIDRALIPEGIKV
jgi:hypothetical protein